MNEIEPGCLAIIIESVFGKSNGTIVQCIKTVGTHSLFGEVWRVRSRSDMITEYGAIGKELDVPTKWLKKIKPDELLKTKTKVLEKIDG